MEYEPASRGKHESRSTQGGELDVINTGEFRNLIREIVRDEIGDRTRYKIGEIASVGDKVTVKFSGEQEPSLKEYTYLKSYYPIVGDRVWLARDKGTYVVLGKLFGDIAGYIIESGNNANGDYARFSDGLQICMFRTELTNLSISTGAGGMYRSGNVSFYYPAVFSNHPVCGSPVFRDLTQLWFTSNVINSQALSGYIFRPVATTTNKITVLFPAIGRWK